MLGDVTQTPITDTAAGARLVVVLARLAAAYLDRMAAADWARAGVVLQLFVETYNANQELLRAYAEALGDSPQLIQRVQAHYDARTRQALQIALIWTRRAGMSEAETRALDEAPAVGVQIQPWYQQVLPLLGPGVTDWVALARSTELSALYGALHRQIASSVQEQSAPVPPAPQTSGETFTITPTRRSAPLMPLWGVVAVGVGVLAVGGIIAHGLVKTRKRRGKR